MTLAKEKIKEELIELAHKLKRIPTSNDIREHLDIRSVNNNWQMMEDLYRDVYGLKVPHKVDRELLYNQWSGINEPVTIEMPDKKVGQFNYKEWLRAAQATQDLHNKASHKQDIATIKINTKKPISLILSSDWHLGSISCDYAQFLRNHEFILNTDGVYMGVIGDEIDNFFQFNNATAILQQVIPPSKQRKLLGEIFNALIEKKKLLFVGYGNHTAERDERWFGDNLVARMVEDKIPYFSGKGIVKLIVGEQMYTILAMHQTSRNSKINALHGVKQEYLNYFPADIVATGHHHTPTIEYYNHYNVAQRAGLGVGGGTWLVKTGTYNVGDGYSARYFEPGIVGNPTLVLSPNIKKMVAFMDTKDAVAFMSAVS